MTKDWDAEWGTEDETLAELLDALREFNECEHDWVEDPEGGLMDEVCTKCGGGRMLLSENEFKHVQGALEDGKTTEPRGVGLPDQGTEEGSERQDPQS